MIETAVLGTYAEFIDNIVLFGKYDVNFNPVRQYDRTQPQGLYCNHPAHDEIRAALGS
jgi:hypothetical protein